MGRSYWKSILGVLVLCGSLQAESQQEYPGVADPFADPSQYEFADEEKEDKEFFHLGRFMMFGLDGGVGIFTGGLGSTTAPSFLFGGKILYFFDKSVAFEARVSYSNHQEQINGNGGTADLDVSLLAAGGGFRYYFDAKAAPRAIAIANPYLAFGGGVYMRNFNVVSSTGVIGPFNNGTAFGGFAGGGVEFLIYRKHVYLGLDLRYHLVLFADEGDTLSNAVAAGARAGDYFTSALTLSYSF